MKITFTLNGARVHVQADPGERLVNILRDDFHLTGLKSACLQGRCGSCMVQLDKKPVPSCLIPAFAIQNRAIHTIEFFKQTKDYDDIKKGFERAGLQTCGYCDAGKYFTTQSILTTTLEPDDTFILTFFSGTICKCTTPKELITGVKYAAENRRKRLYDAQ